MEFIVGQNEYFLVSILYELKDIRILQSTLKNYPSLWSNGNPLQYSCLENPMDSDAQQAIVHRVAKSWTGLNTQACLLGQHKGRSSRRKCVLGRGTHRGRVSFQTVHTSIPESLLKAKFKRLMESPSSDSSSLCLSVYESWCSCHSCLSETVPPFTVS